MTRAILISLALTVLTIVAFIASLIINQVFLTVLALLGVLEYVAPWVSLVIIFMWFVYMFFSALLSFAKGE